MSLTRRNIAAGTTVLALGGLGAAALASQSGGGEAAATTAQATSAPTEVRTEVIHRTVRIVRHVHRRHRAVAPPALAAPPAPGPIARPVVATAPAPAAPAGPLRTHSSGGGRGHGDDDGGERENEHGDD